MPRRRQQRPTTWQPATATTHATTYPNASNPRSSRSNSRPGTKTLIDWSTREQAAQKQIAAPRGFTRQLRPALSNRRRHSIAVEAAANPSTRYSPVCASCLYRISKPNGWTTTAPGLNFKNDASPSTSAGEADSAALTIASDAEVESATVSLTDCRVK